MEIPADSEQEYEEEYNEEKDTYYRVAGFYENPIEIPYTERIPDATKWQYLPEL